MVEQGAILVFDRLSHVHHCQSFLDQVRLRSILIHEADVHEHLHELVLSSKVVMEYKGLLVTTHRQCILQHRQGKHVVILTSVLKSLGVAAVVG